MNLDDVDPKTGLGAWGGTGLETNRYRTGFRFAKTFGKVCLVNLCKSTVN